ncbi:hypothetical protein SAMN05216558_4897 [Pseudomonas vancouverensis]|nr:hypothetical protein SAMN05216558_4897 [Pseudomonas vancouverensis]
MQRCQSLPEALEIRAVDICRLLIIILREYREIRLIADRAFIPVEHF